MPHVPSALAIVVMTLVAHVTPAAAWGGTAHSVVAEIAQRQLGPMALREIERLLGKGVSLASVSAFADTEAALDARLRRTHFVNIPVAAEGYDPARDCASDGGPGCIVTAVEAEGAVLADRKASNADRARALKRLVHLVADIHQPLHCADRSDQGGNQLAVTFHGEPTNLHRVWDFAALDQVSFDWGAHLDLALAALPDHSIEAARREEADVARWATQSHRLAVNVAYKLPEDLQLGADYQATIVPVIHRQLARAGLRLAAVLRAALLSGRPVAVP
ncbi:MAG: S1/P1 nuclease [Hyphomicrobiaceae bacterium]|nr:S1/P1 nuclease [Hyphomicrobiaceae bacterium]